MTQKKVEEKLQRLEDRVTSIFDYLDTTNFGKNTTFSRLEAFNCALNYIKSRPHPETSIEQFLELSNTVYNYLNNFESE